MSNAANTTAKEAGLFVTPKCCEKPNVCTMDYLSYSLADRYATATPRINRVCIRCHTHWFGRRNRVRQYRSKEWDALIAADVAIEARKSIDMAELIRLYRIESAAKAFFGVESDKWEDAHEALREMVCPPESDSLMDSKLAAVAAELK